MDSTSSRSSTKSRQDASCPTLASRYTNAESDAVMFHVMEET